MVDYTFENMYISCKNCYKGVNWKTSTQKYKLNAICNVAQTFKELHNGTYKSRGFYQFVLRKMSKVAKPEHIQTFLSSVHGFLKFYNNERLFAYVQVKT